MESEIDNKEEELKNSISTFSSSRSSSSITSDSSDEQFDIGHFPLPKPSLSDSVLIHQDNLVDVPGSDPNRIPSSVFSSKQQGNPTEWSIASNESLFSIHDMKFSIPKKDDHGEAASLKLTETPIFQENVHGITEINPVKKPNELENETVAVAVAEEENQMESSEEEEKETIEHGNEDERKEQEEEEIVEAPVLVETETKYSEEKPEVAEVVNEPEGDHSKSIVAHSPSISCRSDTSNNSSIGSFAFPILHKEDATIRTPSMEIKGNDDLRKQYYHQLPESPMLQSQPQQTPTEMQPQSQPQRKTSKKLESQTQSPKALKNGWFSCFHFHCPSSKCGFFK